MSLSTSVLASSIHVDMDSVSLPLSEMCASEMCASETKQSLVWSSEARVKLGQAVPLFELWCSTKCISLMEELAELNQHVQRNHSQSWL